MERKYKITIPEPCQEDWDKMTPNDQGRFCISCAKTVVDFTAMFPEEVRHFFIQNQNQNICGRMRKSQLDSITIQIPNRALYIQTQYHKIFLLAMFIVMGTTLFSCTDKNGNKQKIDKIEVVDDSLEVKSIIIKEPILVKKKTLNNPPIKPQIKEIITISTVTGAIEIPIVYEDNSNNETVVEDEIYNGGIGFEFPAEYKGGIEKFYAFFKEEFKQPENIKDKITEILISFVIDKDGSLTYVKPKSEIDQTLENEIVRVLKLCPRWKPGEQNGKKKREHYTLNLFL